MHLVYLPPANEVWGKLIFLLESVILSTGRSGLCLIGLPDKDPSRQRTPLDREPLDRDPQMKTPWTETHWTDTPAWRHPWTETPLKRPPDRNLPDRATPPPDRDPLDRDFSGQTPPPHPRIR